MRATFAVLAAMALTAIAFAGEPKIQVATGPAFSVAGESVKLPLDAYHLFVVKNYVGKVEWEVDPDYEIGFENGKPVLVSGAVDELTLKEPAKIPHREADGPKLIDAPAESLIVWGKKPGKVRISARGVVDGRSVRLDVITLEVIGPRPPPPPIDPPKDPPKDPPIDQPVDARYFLIVRGNGPASEEVRKCLALKAWADVTKAGHKFKDLPLNEVPTKDGKSPIPDGTTLPCLLELGIRPDGKSSFVIPPPRSLPKDDDAVRKLLDVKP